MYLFREAGIHREKRLLYNDLYENVYQKMYARLRPLYGAIQRVTGL